MAETGGDAALVPIPDSIAPLYIDEYTTRASTLAAFDMVRNDLNRLDQLASPDDEFDRSLHYCDSQFGIDQFVLVRRWPYVREQYVREVIATEVNAPTDDEPFGLVKTQNLLLTSNSERWQMAYQTYDGFTDGVELYPSYDSGPTIWHDGRGKFSLHHGEASIQLPPQDLMENLDAFIAARKQLEAIAPVIHTLGSVSLMTGFHFDM